MELFDEIDRTETGPASFAEDSFRYYNRSARVGVVRVRELLEDWFTRYPDAEKAELAARFRAAFDAAFYELFLHEVMTRLRIRVTVHPTPGEEGPRPDFELLEMDGRSYLEARATRDETEQAQRRRRLLATLYDKVNDLAVPDFFLWLAEFEVLGKRQPSLRRFASGLQEWIQSLDYDVLVASEYASLDDYPSWRHEDSDLRVRVSAMPVSRTHRGRPGHRPIGIFPAESKWGGSEASLRKALQRKASKYSAKEVPYIIAVNSLSTWGFDRIDQMAALFGSEQFLIGLQDSEPEMRRQPNGFWQGPRGPQNTRVSAVLFSQVVPWNVHDARLCLYHNPWAAHRYSGRLTRLPQAVPDGDRMDWKDGLLTGEVFDLQAGWTGE